MELELSQQLVLKVKTQNYTKSAPAGAELFCAEGCRDQQTCHNFSQLHKCTYKNL